MARKKLNSYCPNVIVQTAPTTTYDGKTHTLKNIIARFDPNKKIVLFYLLIGIPGILPIMTQKIKKTLYWVLMMEEVVLLY